MALMDSSTELPATIEVLTLNCWGLKFLATARKDRLNEIGRRIAARNPSPEIVGLQECWTQEDYQSIREQVRHILPYGKFYHSGIFGGGLVILSKWPIEESSMVRYSLNGRPTAFFRGDWFVGKGVACARIRIGAGVRDIAEVFCTHLHAPYEREPHDSYICHRTAQAWDIAKLMKGAVERGHLVIGLGDFNMLPLSLAHRLITTHASAQDSWRSLHPNSSVGAAIDDIERIRGRPKPTIDFNLTENGATCDSALNTWRWDKAKRRELSKGARIAIEGSTEDLRAKRLDYVFIGMTTHHFHTSTKFNSVDWGIADARVGMTERHPALGCSLSDHFSVEVTLRRTPSAGSETIEDAVLEPDGKADSINENGAAVPDSRKRYLPSSTYDEILQMIVKYTLRERGQRRLRLTHMLVQVMISICCFIAIWWSPHNFVAFILIVLSTFGLAFGIVDGLIGGLFVGSELRALKEFEWEIKNARRGAIGMEEKDPVASD
ncbi:MAG: phospholipase C type enzyme [Sclerophora amabilis]|nr:MAG: phospholipase C type enzyme [Sclerophora amabilis]